MNDTDRKLLALLAVGVGLVWVSSLHFGDSFGWPGLTTGTGQPADKREGAKTTSKPAKKGEASQSSPNRQGGPQRGRTKPDDGVVVDVYGPKRVSIEEYNARKARARAKQPKR